MEDKITIANLLNSIINNTNNPSPMVILIDDEADDRYMMAYHLRGVGCEVIEFSNGEDAVKYIRLNVTTIKMVFIDLKFPQQSGVKTIKQIKELNSSIPLVIITHNTYTKDIEKACKIGYFGIVEKPLTDAKLIEIFRNHKINLPAAKSIIENETELHKEINNLKERLKFALDSSQIGMWDWNLITNELYCDVNMYKLFGLKEMTPKENYIQFFGAIVEEDCIKVREQLDVAINTHIEFDYKYRLISVPGRIIRGKGKCYYSDDKTPIRITGVCIAEKLN